MTAPLSLRTAAAALTVGGLALAGAVVTGGPAAADNRTVVLRADLTGAAEVPVPGDPDGSGRAQVRVKTSTGQICVTIEVAGIALPAAAAHIHFGVRGAAGPVRQALSAPDADGVTRQCVSNPTLAKALVATPAAYYVNVHTSEFLGGAVRGQLS